MPNLLSLEVEYHHRNNDLPGQERPGQERHLPKSLAIASTI